MIIVTAALIEKDGRILAARRAPGKHMAGLWEFPGGKLEEGEDEKECLARELFEELNIVCQIDDFFAESIYTYDNATIRLRCYHTTLLSGTPECRDHDKLNWVKPSDLLQFDWAPADIPFVDKITSSSV